MTEQRDDLARVLHDAGCPDGADCSDDPMTWTLWYRQADAVIAAGWRQLGVYRNEIERNAANAGTLRPGQHPAAIVNGRLCWWTGDQWQWEA